MTFDGPIYEAHAAAEIAVLCVPLDENLEPSHKPSHIGILDDEHGIVIHELNKPGARALAYRLLQLADELPDPPRRPREIEERMRGRE